MSCQYPIRFAPDSLADYDDVIKVTHNTYLISKHISIVELLFSILSNCAKKFSQIVFSYGNLKYISEIAAIFYHGVWKENDVNGQSEWRDLQRKNIAGYSIFA